MLPIDRQQKILVWLKEEGTLRVSEISSRLGVSEMTVYRDLKPLLEENKVQKTSNGISTSERRGIPTDSCIYCLKPATSRRSVQLVKKDHSIEQACCPHCGLLRYDDIKEDVVQILCRDFLTDMTISGKTATFVIGADLNLNCCHPQVIAFDSNKQARQFQTGFGGYLYNFQRAISAISEEMQGSGCCHD
ncbi:DeoR family transcriptional regulator [Rossellomorea sp. AcN35-11]|nr:DeoR family transcriptional regulator [Rossellomorea aquimaris]WJV30011.1 DeoR family transcriptional regulator [Rossellomorea sp. AcN35-11]